MKVVYDIETFPNFFSVCFYELGSKEFRDFVIYQDRNDLEDLRRYWSNVTWKIGFNNVKFDDVIMRFIMEGGDRVNPASINVISSNIINTQRNGEALWQNPYVQNYLTPYDDSIDLMKIHALHKIGVSLKQVGVILLHNKLQDLPKKPTEDVNPDEVKLILDYGRNDVEITRKLYEYSKEDIKLRYLFGKEYNVNVLSASRTYIAKETLNKYYQEYTGKHLKDFKDLRTYHKSIRLSEIVNDFDFKTDALKSLHKTIKETVITSESKFELIVKTKGMTHKLALGGLHSQNEDEIYEEDDEYALLDVDFASFYPNIMLNYGFHPRHTDSVFLKVLRSITDKRLKAKRTGDKLTADTLKISINSLYGLLGSDYYWLKDDRTMYSVTINGQLLLLGVIEFLEAAGDITCIYSNTDGATFKVKRDILDDVLRKVDLISEKLNIDLEYEMFKKMIVKNVNNFIMIKTNGDIKKKGLFLYEQDVTKGFANPVIQTALYEYYVNDIPVETTIRNEKDIFQFCIAQKTGKQFKAYLRDLNGMTRLQKTNRYFVSTKVGSLVKIKEDEHGQLKETQAVAGENVYVLNDYDEARNDEYFSYIKYPYYIKEANKIINGFNNLQYKLF